MSSVALILLAIGVLLVRQVAVGRALHLGEDFRDAFTALSRGQYDQLDGIGKRRGSDGSPSVTDSATGERQSLSFNSSPGAGASLLTAVQRRASTSTGEYLWGSTGPERYDCSGLVWRGVRDLGFNVPRFTTTTAPIAFRKFATKVSTPKVGDIALWPGRHMGVVSGAGTFFSAIGSGKGIGDGKIWGSPQYWRIGSETS